MGTLSIGGIVINKQDGLARAGEVGVCWRVHILDGKSRYGVIFQDGSADDYSAREVDACLYVTSQVCHALAHYTAETIGKVIQDLRAGRFAAAFPLYSGAA